MREPTRRRNPASAENGKKGGRPVARAVIENGSAVMLSHVTADGTAALGRGYARVTKIGAGRLIIIPQDDGSEIRIVLVK